MVEGAMKIEALLGLPDPRDAQRGVRELSARHPFLHRIYLSSKPSLTPSSHAGFFMRGQSHRIITNEHLVPPSPLTRARVLAIM